VGAALQVLLLTVPANGQETTRVSVDSSGAEGNDYNYDPAISADGQIVAFYSYATNLVAGDTNGSIDIFVHDRSTGLTERVSVDSAGAEGNNDSYSPAITADGQIVAFSSRASNLVAGGTNGYPQVFVHDRSTGLTELVSVRSNGNEGNSFSYEPAISADGQIVAFRSYASNLVVGDTNGVEDVFVHDRATGITKRVSVDSSGAEGNRASSTVAISADGQIVAFQSYASNLVAGDTNGVGDVFVHDRATGITERVSVDSSGAEGNSDSYFGSISADGQIVAFPSDATNLVAGDTNGASDAFVHDRSTGLTERVSVDSSGAEGNDDSGRYGLLISEDGQVVTFQSYATNLVAGDTNATSDAFVHDRATGITERVSVDSSGAEGNDDSGRYGLSISADGQIVAFSSAASNLVGGDTNGTFDIFVHERPCAVDATWSNYGVGFPGTNGVPSFTSQADPVLGTTVTLDLGNSYVNSTVGVVLVGYQETLVPTNMGGDLLVVIAHLIPVSFGSGGVSIVGDLPADDALCGFEFFAQALELDPGAAKGLSFTAGLKLVLGH
jgi:hypothetical protein